ncbi:hypothetical protein PFICI_04316 [Pestalotiopsis fici W106-1]|uniref:Uncharacterized protein n=1 Tax=Pestalotiopsis fici (strain W106-1 / CGMCC3.15140) TaxID=1229662 RepID=W3X8S0_PESFW|nr:uncharacterized protein PFICI_04316 [Pestalotiopsis fici W106-1]ETS82440.1 hypothetical protein PFICI_04316 [Pestalotiopsis fici W106-1]
MFDILGFAAQRLCFNVTDMETLGALFEVSDTSVSKTPDHYSFQRLFLPNITQLDITLRLDLPAVEVSRDTSTGETHCLRNGRRRYTFQRPFDDIEEYRQLWSGVPAKIFEHKELRKLRIWLDHPDDLGWAIVRKREVLSTFERLAIPQHLNLVMYIPLVFPEKEEPKRSSFRNVTEAKGSSLPSFEICRFQRPHFESQFEKWREEELNADISLPLVHIHWAPQSLRDAAMAMFNGLS